MNTPMISIIMSVYNEEKNIRQAVNSILNQTYRDFEFIIIDDASTDQTCKYIESYHDKRIVLYKNKVNKGLTHNLNFALNKAAGKYVARMDGDDISLPERLDTQFIFLEKNPEIKLISCGLNYFGSSQGFFIPSNNYEKIKVKLLLNPELPHPGFMFTRDLFTNAKICYNEKLTYAQDYDFQSKVAEKYVISSVRTPLIKYRRSEKQISVKHCKEQAYCANYTRYRIMKKNGILLKRGLLYIFQKFSEGKYNKINIFELIYLNKILLSIYLMIEKSDFYSIEYYSEEIKKRFSRMLEKSDIIKQKIIYESEIFKLVTKGKQG